MSGSSGFSMTFDADLDFQTDVMSVSDRAISMNILHRSPWRYTSVVVVGGVASILLPIVLTSSAVNQLFHLEF